MHLLRTAAVLLAGAAGAQAQGINILRDINQALRLDPNTFYGDQPYVIWVEDLCGDLWGAQFSPGEFSSYAPSLHVLAPMYTVGTRGTLEYPEYCVIFGGSDFRRCDIKTEIADPLSHCQLSPRLLRTYNDTGRWQTYSEFFSWTTDNAAFGASLEWNKHGSCTGLEQTEYFNRSEDTYNRVANGNGFKFLADNVGREVSPGSIKQAFAQDLGVEPGIVCGDGSAITGCSFSTLHFWFERSDKPTFAGVGKVIDNKEINCYDANEQACDTILIMDYDQSNSDFDSCGRMVPATSSEPFANTIPIDYTNPNIGTAPSDDGDGDDGDSNDTAAIVVPFIILALVLAATITCVGVYTGKCCGANRHERLVDDEEEMFTKSETKENSVAI